MTVIAQRKHKTIYRDGDKTVKVFDTEYSKSDVLNEALNQARIEETGLNIPKLLGVNMIDGKWAIVNEYIEGTTLAELMEKNPEKKDEYIELLVDLQMEVHSKKSPLLSIQKSSLNFYHRIVALLSGGNFTWLHSHLSLPIRDCSSNCKKNKIT